MKFLKPKDNHITQKKHTQLKFKNSVGNMCATDRTGYCKTQYLRLSQLGTKNLPQNNQNNHHNVKHKSYNWF